MDIENLLILKLCADFGLLVLIWLVQLVIYPSFKYYMEAELDKWHSIYTNRITIVVLPLMATQLVLSLWLAFHFDWVLFYSLNLFLVLLTWISTFAIFVPLHGKINQKLNRYESVLKLVKYNWIRTFLWSFIASLTLINQLI